MQLTDDFTVPVSVDRLWELLNDVEKIAPCVPGFTLSEANHPDYTGRMKVKVGAITVTYDATITFVERDEANRRVVLAVKGKELRGGGSVNATITSSLTDRGAETSAEMVTDVQVTGRVAQFGRGIIADVSSRMTEQFVDRLNAQLLAPAAETPEASETTSPQPPSTQAPREEEPLDLGSVAAVPVLKRLAPALGALLLLGLVVLLLKRRSR
ncbi:SRPBCC family protein [Capillimicrobium parvum]|uniref:Carbon monoxide dehydrogenase n=1 Tax=Capillimicrobium parvum TaxID=2884022 RepID=A0A9E6Y2B9_9ACTN|nr:SRPBCC family protein [Capillimicrobium parvum]UGS38987.1 hypothetical protein DSM104329_05419 [Capillimicrobium parvum]